MAIRVECDSCGSAFNVQSDMGGKQVRCSNCSAVLVVPQPDGDARQSAAGEAEQVRPAPVPTTRRRCGAATASLVLGILSLALCVASPLFAAPAIFLGIVALAKIRKSEGALGGEGIAIAGIATGGSSFVLFAIVCVMGALFMPALTKAREQARRAQCKNNLRQISLGLIMYSTDHDGFLPNTFPGQIMSYMDNDHTLLACPARGTGVAPGAVHYEYMGQGGRHVTVSSLGPAMSTIMVYDDEPVHAGGRNVAYVDGHIAWLSEAEFQEQMRNEFNRAWQAVENRGGADQ